MSSVTRSAQARFCHSQQFESMGQRMSLISSMIPLSSALDLIHALPAVTASFSSLDHNIIQMA